MKLSRMVLALGALAWFRRKDVAKVIERARSAGGSAGLDSPRISRTTSSPRPSAASAASGAYRDDRDVTGVGALRDEEVAKP